MKRRTTCSAAGLTVAGRTVAGFAASCLAVAALFGVVLTGFAPPAAAQQRNVVVVGDSIILGAQGPIVAAFNNAGWGITFDAVVSRSTSAGAAAIDSHWQELTDSLVINLGANDAGNTAAYRQKVEQILSSTAGVPHVYWITIREVRDYYPAANQALREVAAGFPNVSVLDWNAATAGSSGLTAGDGLHLTAAGARVMTDLVAGAVVNSGVPLAAPVVAAAAPAAAPATTLPAQTVAPAETIPPSAVAVTTLPSTTVAVPATTIAQSTNTALPYSASTGKQGGEKQIEQAIESGGVDIGSALRWTLGGGFAFVVVLLALAGAALGGWALIGAGEKFSE